MTIPQAANGRLERHLVDSDDQELDGAIARALWEEEQVAKQAQTKSELNRRVKATFLPHNVIHFHALLSDLEQKLVFEDCLDKVGPSGMISGTFWWNFRGLPAQPGTPTNPDNVPPCCIELAKNYHNRWVEENAVLLPELDALEASKKLHIPRNFEAESLIARLWQENGTLGFHVDGAGTGWVMIISIGADIDFEYHRQGAYRPLPDPSTVHTIHVKSGDAVMFNGEVLYHAIKKVHGNTPDWWSGIVGPLKHFTRVGLQMRMKK